MRGPQFTLQPQPQPQPAEGPLLALNGVSASYGPYRALFDVSLAVAPGTAVALVGTNGAGKSTLARVVSGLVAVDEGSVSFDGVDITGRRSFEIARMGLNHLTEGRSVLASLTVEENLVLPFRQALGSRAVPAALERAYASFPLLRDRRSRAAGTLSGGEQRILALARVLVLEQKLLIVDELSFGLAPVVVDEVYRSLGEVLSGGTALVIIEQHIDRVVDLADRVVVLSKGAVVFDGAAAEVESRLGELVLGRTSL